MEMKEDKRFDVEPILSKPTDIDTNEPLEVKGRKKKLCHAYAAAGANTTTTTTRLVQIGIVSQTVPVPFSTTFNDVQFYCNDDVLEHVKERLDGIAIVQRQRLKPVQITAIGRTVTGAYVTANWRNIPIIANPWNIYSFFNPSTSSVIIYIRRFKFWHIGTDSGGNVPNNLTAAPMYVLYRASAISGGVSIAGEIERKDTEYPASAASLIKRELADGAISATLSQRIRRTPITNHGWASRDLLFSYERSEVTNDDFVLRANQGIVMRNENADPNGNTSYMTEIEWDEV